MSTQTLLYLVQAIQDAMQTTSLFRRLPSRTRYLFSIDLALITSGIRTGYLIDVISPRDPIEAFSRILRDLRPKLPLFEEVVLLHDPSSGQSFYVNAPLFRRRYEMLRDGSGVASPIDLARPDRDRSANQRPSFLLLDGCQSLLPLPPANVLDALTFITRACSATPRPLSITMEPPDASVQLMVPLAAFLLEYPVAYVPETSEQTAFLAGSTLDIYECILTFSPPSFLAQHTILKFSCPRSAGTTHPLLLSPSILVAELTERLGTRLSIFANEVSVTVEHHSETLDRVAL